MERNRKRLRVAMAVALILGLMSLADGRGFRRHLKLEREGEALRLRNQQLRNDNAGLLTEIEALRKDPKALERAAREELGFIRPGEVVINLE